MTEPFALDRFPIAFLKPRIRKPHAWVGHIPFVYVLVEMLKPRRIVELGTDSGNSYLAMCQAVAHLGLPTRCTAVDSWRGDAHSGAYSEDVYRTLRAYHDPRYGEFSQLMRAWFDDAVGEFEDGSIDLLHIDGLHTYEAVRNDFETWKPKLSERAVVLFHDSAVNERDFGVGRYIEELSRDYPIFSFAHSNGLSVAKIGTDVGADVEAFFALAEREPARVRGYFEAIGAADLGSGQLADADAGDPEPNIVSKLYYRNLDQGFEESRALFFASRLDPANDRARCSFELPAGLRPDVVRFDPASAPGVYTLKALYAESTSGRGLSAIDFSGEKLLSVNRAGAAAAASDGLRLVCLDDDPWFEIDIRDMWTNIPADAPVALAFDMAFEAVLFDPGMQTAASIHSAAVSELRERLDVLSAVERVGTHIGHALTAHAHQARHERDEAESRSQRRWDDWAARSEQERQQTIAELSQRFDALDRAHERHAEGVAINAAVLQRCVEETANIATGLERQGETLNALTTSIDAERAAMAEWRRKLDSDIECLIAYASRPAWHVRLRSRIARMLRRGQP